MAANPYWIDDRLRSQRVAGRALPLFAPAREVSRGLFGSVTDTRRREAFLPSWVLFTTIIVATFALCVSVTMRGRAEVRAASESFQKIDSDVHQLREANAALQQEVHRLNTDPRAIETAARTRLNM